MASPPTLEPDLSQFQQARAALFTSNQTDSSADKSPASTDSIVGAEELRPASDATQFKQARAALFSSTKSLAPNHRDDSTKRKSDSTGAASSDTSKLLQKELAQFNQETKALGKEEYTKGAFSSPAKSYSSRTPPPGVLQATTQQPQNSSNAVEEQKDSTQFKQAREALFSQKSPGNSTSKADEVEGGQPSPTDGSTQFKQAKAQLFSQKSDDVKNPAGKATERGGEEVKGVQFKEAKALLFSQKTEASREAVGDTTEANADARDGLVPARTKPAEDVKGVQFKEAKALFFSQKSEAGKISAGEGNAGPEEKQGATGHKTKTAEDVSKGNQFREAKAALFNRPPEAPQGMELPKRPVVTRSQASSQFHEAKSALIKTPQFHATFKGSDAAVAAVSAFDGNDNEGNSASVASVEHKTGPSAFQPLLTVAVATAVPVAGCVLLGLSEGLVIAVALVVGVLATYFTWLPRLKAKTE